jgi:hypothetical protein
MTILILFICFKVACKKYEAAIQMLQDMNDRSSSTLAMLGLIKTLLALDIQSQMVSDHKSSSDS